MDNIITEIRSTDKAKYLYSVDKKIVKGAAMNLQEWMSNCKEVLDQIPLENRGNRDRIKDSKGKLFSAE